MSKSSLDEDLRARDESFVWHPFTQTYKGIVPLQVKKAEGTLMYGMDDQTYIDVNSSWWVNIHGHGHPHIGKALTEQFSKVDHIIFAGATHEKAVELAERICQILPDNFQKVFFSDNGSTATEVALKMVFQYFHNQGIEKKRVLAMSGAYHGDTFGAMSVGERDKFNAPFEPFFFDVDYLDFPTQENEAELLRHAESLFQTGDFCCMIVEPLVQGASGMRMYSAEFLDQLTLVAKQNGVLVIFDEVMTGFGRTGKMFAMDSCKENPDIVTLSKGLTAGVLPMGLTITSNEIFNAFLSPDTTKAFLHGHSFTANPLACAVACASLDLFEQPETWKSIESIVQWNTEFFKELETVSTVSSVRQKGTILAFEVNTEKETTYFSDLRDQLYNYCLDNGIFIRPLGNVVFINPPYCITEEEYNKVKSVILTFLKELN
jgi:adenosylmethionine-8-amino-7-oxononanoate aminotransferase